MNPETDGPIDIEELRQMFDENFERLRAESGHTLSPDLKKAAWEQVWMYYRRLRAIAESVTDTEVKLNLPNQETPNKRKFSIEGVVDMVREADHTTMYDIKTHDPEHVKLHLDDYHKQLNVYAHIWQNLRGERLDKMAVICTRLPDENQETTTGWNPVIPIEIDNTQIDGTVREFGEVVDAIEDRKFEPQGIKKLRSKDSGNKTFGSQVCRNCDARFSCSSYREFAKAPRRKNAVDFLPFYETLASEEERQAWVENSLPESQQVQEIADDLR